MSSDFGSDRHVGVVVVGLALLLPSLFVAGPAAADSVRDRGVVFPAGCGPGYGSVVWDGHEAYVFCGTSTQIVRYDPATNAATVMGAHMPAARAYTAAVWIGDSAYIFGGFASGVTTGQVLRYTPATDAAPAVVGDLASMGWGTLYRASAVTDGTNAYLLGGVYDQGSCSTRELVFYPATNQAWQAGTLPSSYCGTSAVADGHGYAFLFGGGDGNGFTSQIVEVCLCGTTGQPNGNVVGALPSPRDATSAAWDGTYAYVFGGDVQVGSGSSFNPSRDVVRVKTNTFASILSGDVVRMSAPLPAATDYTVAVWDGSGADVFTTSGSVLRYTLEPGAPQGLVASAGTGSVSLQWQPPSASSYSSAPTGYRVYRGTPGAEALVAELGVASSYVDSGLTDGQRYFYRVAAVNPSGESPWSEEVSAIPLGVPGAPRDLAATPRALASAPGQAPAIHLSWDPPASEGGTPVLEYRIYRTGGGVERLLGSAGGTATSFDDAWLPDASWAPNGGYAYRVSARNAVGEGDPSATVSCRPQDALFAPVGTCDRLV
ncbi:MAG: hypothetical protein QOE90_1191 [Thermoplasmata archaeon]|nr:hypothetical protein [Thermoplasmata archaeon]